jgi:hypothetical protein
MPQHNVGEVLAGYGRFLTKRAGEKPMLFKK